MTKYFGLGILALVLFGCGPSEKPYTERPLNDLYRKAFAELTENDFEMAADSFDEVERQHPYSAWAAKAQLMSAYSAFKAQKFERAIATLDVFIALHPSSPEIDYAYYLRALCYYTDIGPVARDRENADFASQAFDEVIRRFPNSEYAQDAQFKKDFANEHLASQDMLISMHYLKDKEYLSALKHFCEMTQAYPCSILMPEVLYRIIECQVALGLFDGAQKSLCMIRHNFPQNPWYHLAKDFINRYHHDPKKSKTQSTQ